jgi:hypothetical protein
LMGDEVHLWQIAADDQLTEIARASLDREVRLEEWLIRDISILDPKLLVIGRQVKTDFGGEIDILCIDGDGDLVVIELKRDKTPREVTAQGLDYASWVVGLSNERLTSLASEYLGSDLETEFNRKFESDLPEILNGSHRIVIVASELDESTERIIRYLSDEHGVDINAARFQYFQLPDDSELLVRVFLIEPSEAVLNVRTKGGGKRQPKPTFEELRALAWTNDVGDLYDHAVAAFSPPLQPTRTKSGLTFYSPPTDERGWVAVLNLFPGASGAESGLRYRIYGNRFGRLVNLSAAEIKGLLPQAHEDWTEQPNRPTSDYAGFQGFFTTSEEIDRLAGALKQERTAEVLHQEEPTQSGVPTG